MKLASYMHVAQYIVYFTCLALKLAQHWTTDQVSSLVYNYDTGVANVISIIN